MSSKDYFDALCGEEAGDFIFRTVENVEGVARLRPPEVATEELLRHLFATEGTGSMSLWHVTVRGDDIGAVLVQPKHGRYQYAEAPAFAQTIKKDSFPFRRFTRDAAHATGLTKNYRSDGSTHTVPNQVVDVGVSQLRAPYGFTWRGIVRPNDREMGIAGAELIIVDRSTKEALAVRRLFTATSVGKRGAWWLTAANCSKELATLPAQFIYNVLKPSETGR